MTDERGVRVLDQRQANGFATGTTGGAGGQRVRATTGAAIYAALSGRKSPDTPITIEVEGVINHANTPQGLIDLKRVKNITLLGVGDGAVFDQLGIHLREASNVIIQNLAVRNVKKSGSPVSNGGDALSMEVDVHHVWVDHVTLEASGGESQGFDGLFDLKANTRYVTLSYSILRNSGRGGLVGSSDSDLSSSFVTFHHNLYENIDSRTPLLRGGVAHSYNNHFRNIRESGINSRVGAQVKVEANYFQDSKDVLGTFYTTKAGKWDVGDNIFDNVRWSARKSGTNPAGPDPVSTASIDLPYGYRLDEAASVPDIVRRMAGANARLLVSGEEESGPTIPPILPEPEPEPEPEPIEPVTPEPVTPPAADGRGFRIERDGDVIAEGVVFGATRIVWLD